MHRHNIELLMPRILYPQKQKESDLSQSKLTYFIFAIFLIHIHSIWLLKAYIVVLYVPYFSFIFDQFVYFKPHIVCTIFARSYSILR